MLPNNSKNFCFDANIIIKILTKEPDSSIAVSLLNFSIENNIKIIQPNYSKIEVYSVLTNKLKTNQLTNKRTNHIIDLFNDFEFDYIIEDEYLLKKAINLTMKYKLNSIYDTLYLSHAINNNLIFITADINFYKTVYSEFKNVIYPLHYFDKIISIVI